MHNLIIGCGRLGVRVAARAIAAGQQVTGIVKSQASAERVRQVGAQAQQIDLDEPIGQLVTPRRLFYFAPPQRQGQHDQRLLHVIRALKTPPEYIVYISTSGVYGDHQGDWVDETCPVNPNTERAIRRVAAEQALVDWCPETTILRAPGIYGPERLPIEKLRAGEPILEPQYAGWTNLVHVDDLAALAWHAGQAHWPHTVYNACDGHPLCRSDYYDYLAKLLNLPKPPSVSWQRAQEIFSPMRLSFYRSSRRLTNKRVCEELGYRFIFSDFKAGLHASVKALPKLPA